MEVGAPRVVYKIPCRRALGLVALSQSVRASKGILHTIKNSIPSFKVF